MNSKWYLITRIFISIDFASIDWEIGRCTKNIWANGAIVKYQKRSKLFHDGGRYHIERVKLSSVFAFAKPSIFDIWQGSEYASIYLKTKF